MSSFLPNPGPSASAIAGPWRFGTERAGSSGELRDWSVEWVLKRNCSLAPGQLFGFFGILCALSVTIAAFFWLQGATMIATFAGLELAAVAVALLVYSRHATDQENIAMRAGLLTVQHTSGAVIETAEFVPEWVRVEPVTGDESLIQLSGRGQKIEVGRFIRPELRKQLANELRYAIRLARARTPAATQPE